MKVYFKVLMILIENDCRKVSTSTIQRMARLGYNDSVDARDVLVENGAIIKLSDNHYELAPQFILMSELSITAR